MHRKLELVAFGLCAILLNLCCDEPTWAESSVKYQRSKDTHAIEDVPTRQVEKEAQRQLEESADIEKNRSPASDGQVISTAAEKKEVSSESTFVGENDPSVDAKLHESNSNKRPTVALALGGGGARGAAHVGVLRVLKEANIPIDYIVGNSMGSIVGGLYAAGVPLDDIEKMLLDNSLKRAYMPGFIIPTVLIINPLKKLINPFKKHYAGIFTGNKFGKFLEEKLPESVENVEDTPIPFSAVATNLIDGKAYRISDGQLSTAIRASSTIPSLLQPVAIGDKVYVDGGVRANMPASAARDTGADIVIAVLVDEPLKDLPAKKFRKLSAIISRLGDVMLGVSDARQMPFADIIINPDVSGIPVVKGKTEDAERAIKAGEEATRKALPVIRKQLKKQGASR